MQPVVPPGTERPNGTHQNGSNGTNGHTQPPQSLVLPVSGPGDTESEGGFDFHAVWNAFRRRWFLALSLGIVLGVPAAIGAWMLAPAPYVAFAELRLNSINKDAFPGSKGGRVPEFSVWKQAVMRRASHPMVLKEVLRHPEIQSATMVREQEPHVTPWLEEQLSVKSVADEYIRLELEGEHPKELAAILNAVVKELIRDVDHELYEERTNRQKNLDSLITEARTSIAAKTTELENMRNALKVDPAEIERRQSYLIELTSSLRSALVSIEVEKLKLLATPSAKPASVPGNQIDQAITAIVEGDPRYQRALGEISSQNQSIASQERLIRQQSDAVNGLDESHPSRVAAVKRLASLKAELTELSAKADQVREDVKQEVLANLPEGAAQAGTDPQKWLANHQQVFKEAFVENEKKLKSEIEEIKAEQKDLERYSLKGSRITRDIEREQTQLESYQDESQKLRFEIENTPALIEMSRMAEVPHARSLKKKTMLTGIAGLGVFSFFVAGIVFLEFRTRRIATIGQVSEKLNLRVMGSVPLLPSSAASGKSVKKKAKNALWYSALTEAIDSTRTLLIRGAQLESLKTVMIASAVGGEGKTTLASHLATSLARGGRRILLIDCDLRRPCMHRAFGLTLGKGVCEILRGEVDLHECIQPLESPAGLSVLPAGKINQQALKLLALDALRDMLEPLKQEFDFIIIDSSPLLPVTDGLLVAQHADGVILSIRRDVSRIGKVVMACQKLSMLGIPMLGAVTIGLQEESGYKSRYGYNYYGYGYRQHYHSQPPPN